MTQLKASLCVNRQTGRQNKMKSELKNINTSEFTALKDME